MDNSLSDNEKEVLLHIARSTIEARVYNRPLEHPPREEKTLNNKVGCFVSIKNQDGLCGCLGTFESESPLYLQVAAMAEAAASKDPRFPPLRPEDVQEFNVEISVLSPLKKIEFSEEIEIGTHGIFLERSTYRGVLLPQVAVERGWDRETFLKQTCIKAGLPQDAWSHADTSLYIFSAHIFAG